MRHPPSLTLRLTLLFGITVVVVFLFFGWFIGRSIEDHFANEDVRELQVIARAAQRVLTTAESGDGLTRSDQRFNDILVGHHNASLYLAGRDERPIFASPGPDFDRIVQPAAKETDDSSVRQWTGEDHTYRVLIQAIGERSAAGGPYTLAVAVPIDYHLRFVEKFRDTLWLMVGSGIGVMSLIGWIVVRHGHAPLHNIVAQIRHISAAELNTRLPPETMPRELTDLAVAFNELLERMEEAFLRLSNFSADIAHELRTPVTNLLTQTQVALSKPRSVDEYREILYSNIEEYERMAQMIGDMLFLAKTDNRLYEPNTVDVDLAREVLELFEYYEAWAEERGVSLTLEGHATAPGDRLMLRRALSNLLSNAIRHTPSGDSVRVCLDREANQAVTVTIENPGPVIPPEHIPRLFDRFYRVDASRQRSGDGAGLGLAIAKSIVDIHGGKIEATSTEGCTQFRITLLASLVPIRSK
ncbi:hypothetical protein Tel_11905 [Candidatus Tenderia electrophaga]|jgi:two-component system heavy metal sensor histidine kinase CusS|uniref:Sensor protein n=1 Tax=Candidatus Tenderia electrophaga TaxID=1748243 RepID=A0A0S2TF82_9GAMM|nr:hypothetical protein Tel_11905 [Candidatus Tenderia electrophaga]